MALPDHYVAELLAVARAGGLDEVGVCTAKPFVRERQALVARKRAGLHAGMEFTFRNPERATDPGRTVRDAHSLLVGALGYRRRRAGAAGGLQADVASFAWRRIYDSIESALAPVVDRLRADGHRAMIATDDNYLVDRAAAVRAALGWYGKNANVLLPGRGSWYAFGAVITDAPLADRDPAPVGDGCGPCTRCIEGCPTGAIVAPGVIDARRCLAWVLQAPGAIPVELRAAAGTRIYGCDDCQEVCPPNRRVEGQAPEQLAADVASVQVEWVLTASDTALDARVGHWYVHERDFNLLRRNALVAVANAASTSIEREGALELVRPFLTHMNPMLREHAEWAERKLAGG